MLLDYVLVFGVHFGEVENVQEEVELRHDVVQTLDHLLWVFHCQHLHTHHILLTGWK